MFDALVLYGLKLFTYWFFIDSESNFYCKTILYEHAFCRQENCTSVEFINRTNWIRSDDRNFRYSAIVVGAWKNYFLRIGFFPWSANPVFRTITKPKHCIISAILLWTTTGRFLCVSGAFVCLRLLHGRKLYTKNLVTAFAVSRPLISFSSLSDGRSPETLDAPRTTGWVGGGLGGGYIKRRSSLTDGTPRRFYCGPVRPVLICTTQNRCFADNLRAPAGIRWTRIDGKLKRFTIEIYRQIDRWRGKKSDNFMEDGAPLADMIMWVIYIYIYTYNLYCDIRKLPHCG